MFTTVPTSLPMTLNASSTRPPRVVDPPHHASVTMPSRVAAAVIAELASEHQLSTRALALRAGVCPRRMRRVVAAETETVTIHFVDRMLTALGEQHRWHDEPLARWYA